MTHAPAGYRVLVVDDDDDSRDATVDLVSMLGYQPRGASNAREALQIARSYRPAIALVGIVLPDASGYEVARKIRALHVRSGIRLIALTGLTERAIARQAFEAGFDYFLSKPCSVRGLAALLNSMVVTPEVTWAPERPGARAPGQPSSTARRPPTLNEVLSRVRH